jgi:hypothetical protein
MIFTILTEIKRSDDGDFISSVVDSNDQKIRIKSPHFTPGDKENLRCALDIHFYNLAYVLRKRQFPEHTIVVDLVKKDRGVAVCNARYPDEQISSPLGEENQESELPGS